MGTNFDSLKETLNADLQKTIDQQANEIKQWKDYAFKCEDTIEKLKEEKFPRRGDLWWVSFTPKHDLGQHVQAKTRPMLVIQNDVGNLESPNVIFATISGAEKYNGLPTWVAVPEGIAGLVKDSFVACENLSTIGKVKLIRYMGTLPKKYMKQVDKALKVSIGVR